jgi:hypothetical protein
MTPMTKRSLLAPLLALAVTLPAVPAMAQSAQPAPAAPVLRTNPVAYLIGILLPAPQVPRDSGNR